MVFFTFTSSKSTTRCPAIRHLTLTAGFSNGHAEGGGFAGAHDVLSAAAGMASNSRLPFSWAGAWTDSGDINCGTQR